VTCGMAPRAVLVLLVSAWRVGGHLELAARVAVPPAAAGTLSCARRLRGGSALEEIPHLFAEPDNFFEPEPLPGHATSRRGPSRGVIELVTASRSPLWVRMKTAMNGMIEESVRGLCAGLCAHGGGLCWEGGSKIFQKRF